MGLQVFWLVVIAFFWIGFFILEGLDMGVGALHMVVGQVQPRTPGGHKHYRPHLGR